MTILIAMMKTMMTTSGLESFVALLFAETVNTSLALPSEAWGLGNGDNENDFDIHDGETICMDPE